MIKLKNVTINKYKCIETEQSFDVEDDITVLVGKNESGKTAILEAITKSNPYLGDRFDVSLDFPRKEKKRFDRSQKDVTVIQCTYKLSSVLLKQIEKDIGPQTLNGKEIIHTRRYRTKQELIETPVVNSSEFFKFKFAQHGIGDTRFKEKVSNAQSIGKFPKRSASDKSGYFLSHVIKEYFQYDENINDSLRKHLIEKWVKPYLPRFLYYDEYYELPSEVRIIDIQSNSSDDKRLETAKALFELADISIDQLLKDNDYEAYKSELEATGVDITLKLFEYWKTNSNLRVEFDIDRQRDDHNEYVPILKIRVFNNKYLMSLPLGSRSRGFNWFFSFLVWFSRIQEDSENQYILLMDEPGLNLHASAQKDLLRFIEALSTNEEFSNNYQIIYTTHSRSMIGSNKLHRVRTVFESEYGTRISDVATETDPDTLNPLYAALGDDIAQHFFISTNNLLVEGVSDYIYLTVISAILEGMDRTGLRDDIAIVPVGGADKVATFIALVRGQELNIACLLDTFIEDSKQRRVDDLIDYRVIHRRSVRYFHEFANNGREADIEDMFEKDEYLILYNEALTHDLKVNELDPSITRIVEQIRKKHRKFRAHYQVAKQLAAPKQDTSFISEATLARFEKMFKEINRRFEV